MAKNTKTENTSTKAKSGTIVLSCACAQTFQDTRYGKGKRVHNIMKSGSVPRARCTGCGKERDV